MTTPVIHSTGTTPAAGVLLAAGATICNGAAQLGG